MARSMTGFSRLSIQTKEGRCIGEMASLNKKFFEVSLFLPKEFFLYEMELRKKIQERISRGQVTLRVFFYPHKPDLLSVLPDPAFLKTLKKGWEERAVVLGLDKKNVDLSFLAEQIKETSFPKSMEDEKIKKILHDCVDQLIDKLIIMKKNEGNLLLIDIKKRLKKIEKSVGIIEKIAKTSVSQYREKLLQKVKEYFTQPQDEERLLKEVLLFAEKVDITEEIVRFRSHITQLYSLFKADKEEVIGRKLEFFVQELHREINTMGSKTQEVLISQEVVEVKSELEKIREQVQNIE